MMKEEVLMIEERVLKMLGQVELDTLCMVDEGNLKQNKKLKNNNQL